jgi:hypothetical protein
MAKNLALVSGRISEVLGLTSSSGAGDAGKFVQTDSDGRLNSSLMPPGITADQKTGLASGTVTAKDLVAIELTTGAITRASAASGGNQASGFAQAGAANGASVTAQLEGIITGLTGLTPGARYYLSDSTPGGITATPVSGTGKIHQYVGQALSATELNFEPDDGVVLA